MFHKHQSSSHFGFKGWISVLIASVPGLRILSLLYPRGLGPVV